MPSGVSLPLEPVRQVHQLSVGFTPGDAISNYARLIRRVLARRRRAGGVFSDYRFIDPVLRGECGDLKAYAETCRPEDLTILHLSMGSRINNAFRRAPGRKVIIYHNITPAEYFTVVDPPTAAALAAGRRELGSLAGTAELALADSEYNRRELAAAGYPRTGVLHLPLDLDRLAAAPGPGPTKEFAAARNRFLYVGRLAPNKKVEDLLFLFHVYQRYVEPDCHLFLVGPYGRSDRYLYYLKALIGDLNLRGVHLTGKVPLADLVAYYRLADLYVSLSEHEGFCLPLLEAMHFGLPILAYRAGAVPETLGEAGVLVKEKDYPLLAELADRLIKDGETRGALARAGHERLQAFRQDDFARKLLEQLRLD